MSKQLISDHYMSLGAKLRNNRNSWGAVRDGDGAVFLSVWRDEARTIDGKSYYQVLRGQPRKIGNGYRERVAHLEQVRQGAPCYLIACTAVDQHADDRQMRSFQGAYLYATGDIIEVDGDLFIEEVGQLLTRELMVVVPS